MAHAALDNVEVDDRMPDAPPIRVAVQDDNVERSTYAWRVAVLPSREPRRWSYLREELAIAAGDIEETTGVNIIFWSLDPVSEPTAATA